MPLTDRVKQILSWYGSDNPGTRANLVRMMNTGTLAGTGKMVILPVDQGFEHGPFRSFGPNEAGMDPDYHFQLAIDSGCNAYAAPLGFIEAVAQQMFLAQERLAELALTAKTVLQNDSTGSVPAMTVWHQTQEAISLLRALSTRGRKLKTGG